MADDFDGTLRMMMSLQEVHDVDIKSLCERIGYGNVMSSASRLWRGKCIGENMPLGNFAVGPCECMTVPCPHPDRTEDAPHCEWCCGSGWLTKHVAGALAPEVDDLRTFIRENVPEAIVRKGLGFRQAGNDIEPAFGEEMRSPLTDLHAQPEVIFGKRIYDLLAELEPTAAMGAINLAATAIAAKAGMLDGPARQEAVAMTMVRTMRAAISGYAKTGVMPWDVGKPN